MSVSVLCSVAFNRSVVAGEEVCEDCALAIEGAVRKSAVVPIITVFNIGNLLVKVPPKVIPHKLTEWEVA